MTTRPRPLGALRRALTAAAAEALAPAGAVAPARRLRAGGHHGFR